MLNAGWNERCGFEKKRNEWVKQITLDKVRYNVPNEMYTNIRDGTIQIDEPFRCSLSGYIKLFLTQIQKIPYM